MSRAESESSLIATWSESLTRPSEVPGVRDSNDFQQQRLKQMAITPPRGSEHRRCRSSSRILSTGNILCIPGHRGSVLPGIHSEICIRKKETPQASAKLKSCKHEKRNARLHITQFPRCPNEKIKNERNKQSDSKRSEFTANLSPGVDRCPPEPQAWKTLRRTRRGLGWGSGDNAQPVGRT